MKKIREMYKNLIRKYHQTDQIGYLHEWFMSLSTVQLSKLKLSIQLKTSGFHENIAVHVKEYRDSPHVLLVKRPNLELVYWSTVSHE